MPEQTNSPEGACKRFECKVIGYPRPSIRWYKDGENITTHRRYKFDYTPDGCIVLIIERVSPSDQGVYECKAENSEGTAESSALLHVRGGAPHVDDDVTSIHSMSFDLLDSQRRPLIFEQKRQNSSDQSEDSVIDQHSDTAISKWDINGDLEVNNNRNNIDNSPDITADSSIYTDRRNEEELFAETVANLENSGESKSRRWTLDSGITSRGSSISSDPDINLNNESILEMQKYLHGKNKVNTNNTDSRGNRKGDLDTPVGDSGHSIESELDTPSENQVIVETENVKNLNMEGGDLTVVAYELYQDDDIGHHFCTSKHEHTDHIEENIDWEHVDDHEASILAGKFLFAHGKDAEAEEATHPLSEWEIIKQTEESQFVSGDKIEKSKLGLLFEGYDKTVESQAASQSQSFVQENDLKLSEDRIDTADKVTVQTNFSSKQEVTDLITAESHQESFSASINKETRINETYALTILDANIMKVATAKETTKIDKHDVQIQVSEESFAKIEENKTAITQKVTEQQNVGHDSVIGVTSSDKSKLDVSSKANEQVCVSEEGLVGSAEDEESYDLDIDRSEQTVTKRSQQFRRPSATDNLTSELVEQLSTKEKIILKEDDAVLNSETKEIEMQSTVNEGDSFELDIDRQEQTLSSKSRQFRRPSAQDSLTSEVTDQLLVTQKMSMTGDEIQLDSKSTKADPSVSTDEDDSYDLDVDRREEIFTKRSQQYRRASAQDNLTSEMTEQLIAKQNIEANAEQLEVEESQQLKVMSSSDTISQQQHSETVNEPTLESTDVVQSKSDDVVETANDDLNKESLTEEKSENKISAETTLEQTICESDVPQDNSSIDIEDEKHQQANTEGLSESSLLNNEIKENDPQAEKLEVVEIDPESINQNDKSQTVPFEKLSLTERDDILKQISDISLGKGRRGRKLKATDDADGIKAEGADYSEKEKVTVDGNSIDSQSAINDSEENKQLVALEKQTSQAEDTAERTDKSKLKSLEVKESSESISALEETVNEDILSKASLEENLQAESIANEIGSKSQTEEDVISTQQTADNLESDINLTVAKTIEHDKEPLKSLFEAEERSEEQKVSPPLKDDNVESLEDTRPEVPNIINFSENIKSKSDIKCEITEESKTAQEEINVVTHDSAIVEIDHVEVLKSNQETENEEKYVKADVSTKEKNTQLVDIKAKDGETIDLSKDSETTKLEKIEITESTQATVKEEQNIKAGEDIKEEAIQVSDAKEIDDSKQNEEAVCAVVEETNKISTKSIEGNIEVALVETSLSTGQNESEIEISSTSETQSQPSGSATQELSSTTEVNACKADIPLDVDDADISEPEIREAVITVSESEPAEKQIDIQESMSKQDNKPIEVLTQVINDTSADNKDVAVSVQAEQDADKKTEIISLVDDQVLEKPLKDILKLMDKVGERPKADEAKDVKTTVGEPTSVDDNAADISKHIDTVEEPSKGVVDKVEDVQKIQDQDEMTLVQVREGEPITLQWDIEGLVFYNIDVTKGGLTVEQDNRLTVIFEHELITLHIDSATPDDEAIYSINYCNSEVAEASVIVAVRPLIPPARTHRDLSQIEPAFVVEPTLEKDDERRMSIKCSVSGVPEPYVTWYKHGKPLGQGELWDVYSKDGYHYLANSGNKFMECEEIVCRVENEAGYIQSILQMKKEGDEITCQPVQREAACPKGDTSPHVELQLTETSNEKMMVYTLTSKHRDNDNKITVQEGEKVHLLGSYDTEHWITKPVQKYSQICYVPKHLLQACVPTVRNDDVNSQEFQNVAQDQLTEQINKTEVTTELKTPQTKDTTDASTMPERRKITPGSKLHGTQDDHDRGSPDIESKLGFKEDLDNKKDVSDHTISEYEDGTSRPMFKKRLKTVVTRTGELCQMECIVRGSPLPKVLWLKNNRPLKESDGCQVIADEETNMLVFPEVREDDVGVYTARAMNVNGSVMSTAELNLEDGRPMPFSESTDSPMDLDFTTPSYFFQMSSCQVAEGRMARFDCRVVAYPRPEIVWMRDGKVIESEERFRLLNMNNEIYSLLIQDVQLTDSGRYTCWARNKFGEAMTEAYLNVIALKDQQEDGDMAPKFLTKFYDQQTTEGTPTEFKCLIAGKPEPSVTWLLNDIEMKDASGVRQRHVDSVVSLEMKSPKVDQSGEYICQLKNSLGEATCSARLTVIEDKLHGRMLPKFLRKFDHLTVKDGEEAKFSCVIVGEPKADVIWMFDHKPIPDSNRRFIRKKDGDMYSLIVKNARIDDTGVITCKAVNDEGEVYCSANLHVRESRFGRETPEKLGLKPEQKESKFGYVPTFTKRLQDVAVSEGATAKFECRVMGIPEPEVTWMKDGRVIPAGGRYHMIQEGDTCYLKIDNVSASDTGVYTCIVSNNQGKSSSSAALKMEGLTPMDKYLPEKPVVDTYKKERYTPDRKLEDTYTRKSRYTPERYLEDSYTKKTRYTPERYLEDSYAKKRYTPERYLEDTYSKKTRYTPERYLEDTYTKKPLYTPDRYLEDTYKKRYSQDRYSVPDAYTSDMSLKRPFMETSKLDAIPKVAYDRPTLLNKTDESVRLSWIPVSTHELPADSRRVSYIVESRELPSSVWTKVGFNVPSSSYLVRNLRPDKEYEFRVRAQNHHGISEPSRSATLEKRIDESRRFADLPEVKAPPRLPTHRPIITDIGEEMVRLAWRPVESYKSKRIPPVSYQLEAKELPGKDWMPISTRLRDTTHYLSELEGDRDYMIRVRAENDFGVSEPTEPLWLPRARAFPGVPVSRPEIIEVEPHRTKLSWSRVDVPAFGLNDVPLTYMLEVEEPPKDWRTIARDLDDTEYMIEGLKPERDYRFRIRAKTPTGLISEPSPAVSLYTALAKARPPVDRLEVLDYEPDSRSLQLSWQRVEIPPYSADEEPLMYMLEYQEPPLPDWRPLVTGIPTTRYRVMHLDPERDYNFRVRALTPYGVSPPSAALPVSMRQPPTAIRHLPQDVIISEVEPDSLRLSWRRPMVDLATSVNYQIEMLEPMLSDWRPIATRVTDTTYKVTGLRPTRDYQFRVIPYADMRPLAATSVVGLTSSAVRPRLHLSEPKLREMGLDAVQLSWKPAELPLYQRSRTPMYYGVEMMELPSTNWVPVARKVPETSYLVTGLKPDRDYKFRVTAETDQAKSEPSLSAVLHRKPAPVFPREEPTVRDFMPNAVMLSWQPATVPEGISLPISVPITYSVEAQTPPGISTWSTLHGRHPTPSVKLSDLRPDLDYLVRVRAHYGDYTSEPTLPVYIPRRAAPPRIPHEEPYAIDIGADSVKLQWRSADLPVHIMDYAPVTYRIEAQELPGGNWVNVARGVPHTDFKVTGLNPKNDYCFRVRAENDYGLSDPTRPVTIEKRCVGPALPHEEPLLYDLGPGSGQLSWRPATLPIFTQPSSPTTYTIFVQELPYKTWRPHVKRIPQTWYHISGLSPDKEYNFRVQAENEFGTSKPTPAVYMPRISDLKRPISMPEVDDFDEDLTSVKLHWKPKAGPTFDKGKNKYLIESWEPFKREWFPVARDIPDTSYQLRGLPAASDRLFRIRLESEQAGLSEPSVPVSVSHFFHRRPVHRPQLYELDNDSVRLSWEPAFIPTGTTRRPVRYMVDMREIPEKSWRQAASDLLDTNYKIRGLRSKSDYEFRVKALIDGETSEPSLPVALYRRSAIPKVRFDVPEVSDVDDDALTLRWNKVDVPAFSYDDEPLSFMIERQSLPGYQWEPVATNLTGSSYRVRDLKPYQDYAFRVRGVYPSGYTEPSPNVPVYRRPIRLSVPIARPEIWEEEPYTARLKWHRAYIPHYHSSRPLRYRIEMQEAGPTVSDWTPVATDVTTPDFTVNELSPRKDYNFRIRAELENGDLTEPTPPIQYYRSQLPMSKETFSHGDYKPVNYEITLANRTYVEHLTKYVPPRLPIDKPEMVVINPETVELAWKQARVPDSIKHSSNLTYTIEVRTPPSFEWRELVSSLKEQNHTVKKLHPRIDYIFRIRAWNEYGCSEPSLPVSLYRPIQHGDDDSYDEDEAWEREWELRFGQQEASPIPEVPPKLPMDTPKIITQSPESIWFSWVPARIPAYATQTPITYVIEVKEPPETSWKRQEAGVVDCQYTLEGMNPTRDYHIRVRAETEFGPSEPTLPIMIKRSGSRPSSRPGSRLSSMERELKPDEAKLDTKLLETLTAGVPPRMASNRPLSSNVQPTSLTLTWSSGRVPSYVKNSTIVYIIEKREPPGHIWTVLARDIPAARYDVTGLDPELDYMFRVRAKNDFGTSEPTLPMTLYRERDDYVPQKFRSRSGSRDSIQALVSRRGRSTSFDFSRAGSEEVDICMKDQIPTQPEYTSTPKWDTQYGVEGKKGKIALQVRGFPLPTIHWYLDDEKLDYQDKYSAFISPSGTVTLEIKKVGPETMGTYKCYAENESGSAVKYVKYEFADPPTVLEPLQDTVVATRTLGRLTCRVDGVPSPTAKWMKDWHPVKDSTRIKVIHEAPDVWGLEIENALSGDSGLYACTMENVAGKVTMTARLVVEDQEPTPMEVELKKSPIEDSYHILEEIGRSRQGVIRRLVEKQTGKSYAGNFIFLKNKAQKNFFMTEFEILRMLSPYDHVLTLHDAFETERSLILVTDIIPGTDLLDKLITEGDWTETKAAETVKNLLGILQILSSHNIQHMDIKPSNIYLCGPDSTDMKLMNFALARQLIMDEELTHNYGSVGYASPEQVAEDIITDKTDMWAIGVLAYVLLTGEFPCNGANDFEILHKTKNAEWSFSDTISNFSAEAKDFISKLLVKNPSERMSVDESLKHPWLATTSDIKLDTEKLKQFYEADKEKRQASKCFITANLQNFNKVMHGASALYQPAMDQDSGEIIFPDTEEYGDFLSEDAWYEWQLHYMDDPDTQYFPLENKDFTVRESRHTAVDDEETFAKKPEAKEAPIDSSIMFRNKIQTTTFIVGESVTFTCTVATESPAVVTWYRDEQLLSENEYRTESKYNEDTGEAYLTISNLKDYDASIYKCVARNKDSRVSCEARLLLGDVPGKPGMPVITQISGSEAFLTWTGPISDGNSYVLGYRIDFKTPVEERWTRGPFVSEEYCLLTGLVPSTDYIFRVSCHSKYGSSPYSWASLPATTGSVDAPKVELAKYLKPLLQFSSYDKQQLILQAASRRPSLTVAPAAKLNEGKLEENYKILERIAKGSYGEYRLCSSVKDKKQYVMKIMPLPKDKDKYSSTMHEFDLMSNLRQVNIITVYESFVKAGRFCVVYEKLSEINVVQYLCLRKFYSEETVSRIVRQILDGLQYLQQLGVVHLNLQPSSIVMATRRQLHVKLRDFTHAQKLEDGKEIQMKPAGYPDFIAPEILREEPTGHPADIWSLGALTFVLLSGTSPFAGANIEETLNKIIYDRFSVTDMYDNVSKEGSSFLRKMLKRLPKNRATVNKCLDSKWLQLTDSMIKSRNSHLFRTETLRDFSIVYLERRGNKQYMNLSSTSPDSLAKPTVGPVSKPILSKRLPKYYKPVTKSNKDDMADMDSIANISLEIRSVLDKIETLKEALDSGTDLPEFTPVTKKSDEINESDIAAESDLQQRQISDIQLTQDQESKSLDASKNNQNTLGAADSKSIINEAEHLKLVSTVKETGFKKPMELSADSNVESKVHVESLTSKPTESKQQDQFIAKTDNQPISKNKIEAIKGLANKTSSDEPDDRIKVPAESLETNVNKIENNQGLDMVVIDEKRDDEAVSTNDEIQKNKPKSQETKATKTEDRKEDSSDKAREVKQTEILKKEPSDVELEQQHKHVLNINGQEKAVDKLTEESDIPKVSVEEANKLGIESSKAELLKDASHLHIEEANKISNTDMKAKPEAKEHKIDSDSNAALLVKSEQLVNDVEKDVTMTSGVLEKETTLTELKQQDNLDETTISKEKELKTEHIELTEDLVEKHVSERIESETKTEENKSNESEVSEVTIQETKLTELPPEKMQLESVMTEKSSEVINESLSQDSHSQAISQKKELSEEIQRKVEERVATVSQKDTNHEQSLVAEKTNGTVKPDISDSKPMQDQSSETHNSISTPSDNSDKALLKPNSEEHLPVENHLIADGKYTDETAGGHVEKEAVSEQDRNKTDTVIKETSIDNEIENETEEQSKAADESNVQSKLDETEKQDNKSDTPVKENEGLINELIEEIIKPLQSKRDVKLPDLDGKVGAVITASQKSPVLTGNEIDKLSNAVNFDILEEENKATASDTTVVDDVRNEVANTMEIIEEAIESETAKRNTELPNLDFKNIQNKAVSSVEQTKSTCNEIMLEEDNNKSQNIPDKAASVNELNTDRDEEKTHMRNVGSQTESKLSSVDNDEMRESTELNSKVDAPTEPESDNKALETINQENIIQKSDEASELMAEVKQSVNNVSDNSKRWSAISEDEKRSSMSSVSGDSEYLDALCCSTNKDLKCKHDSTPDSVYATPDREISKGSFVTDDETSSSSEIVEKANTEDVKETPTTKEEVGKNKLEEKHDIKGEDNLNKEKKSINEADVEPLAEQLVSDAMEDAFKVAEQEVQPEQTKQIEQPEQPKQADKAE